MKATIKTGGKQYNVAVGDFVDVEKLEGKEGATVNLEAVCIIDGDEIEADPAKASKTAVKAKIVKQFKGEKKLVFKFKRRKNYKVKNGHRQQLTKLQITEIGTEKASATKTAAKPAKKTVAKKPAAKKTTTAKKPAAKKTTTAKKPATKAATKSAAKKTTTAAKKPAAKKTTTTKNTAAKKPAAKKTSK